MMYRGERLIRKASFDPGDASDRVTLDFDRRYRRRFRLFTDKRRDILIDFEHCEHMRDGDAIALSDGSLVLVCARPEELLEITAESTVLLRRIAWALGNSHLPVQFTDSALRVRADHVVAEVVIKLGANVRSITASFDPDTGTNPHRGTA